MAERWLTGIHPRLRALPPTEAAPKEDDDGAVRDRPFDRTRGEAVARQESRSRRRAAYTEVRRRHAAGESRLGLSRVLALARGTVLKYAYAASSPERAVRALEPSLLDPYPPHLVVRHTGCTNGHALWREIRALGDGGTHRQVLRWLNQRRSVPRRHRLLRTLGCDCRTRPRTVASDSFASHGEGKRDEGSAEGSSGAGGAGDGAEAGLKRLRARGLAAIERVKEKLGDVTANVLDINTALAELAEPGVVKAAGYADFEDACRRGLKVHPTTARRWTTLATTLRRQFALTVGLDRAHALLEPADATPADDDTAEDLLAATLTLPSGEKLVVKHAGIEELDAASRAFPAGAAGRGRGAGAGLHDDTHRAQGIRSDRDTAAQGAKARTHRGAARGAARRRRRQGDAPLAVWAELLAALGAGG